VNHVQTVIFDLSEVLIAGLLGIEGPLAEQLRLPADTIRPAFSNGLQELCCGRLTEDEYLERILLRESWRISREQLKRVIRCNFHHQVPGMQPILDRLRRRYQLVLMSDHAREWMAYIRTIHSFFDKFAVCFFSFELGQTKTSAAAFTMVLDRLERPAHACLLVDDSERNVAVARSVGIRGVRFVDSVNLRLQLRQAGLAL
jgi:HAD superfamily hydrolase (TIGR01509 family)